MSEVEAFEVVGDPGHAGPFVLTCEHATNRLPPEIRASAEDRVLLDDHWGWDLGAADVTRTLVHLLGGQAVLSCFSRLVIDPNRDLDAPSLIVSAVDGQPVSFNIDIDAVERQRRIDTLFSPYHDAVDELIRSRIALGGTVNLVAIHSFTPSYLGRARPMEVGVLFDAFDEDAWILENALADQGFESALNAPYSGRPPDNLIYSAKRHGEAHGIEYLELEIRQDLLDTEAKARAVAERIATALQVVRPARG